MFVETSREPARLDIKTHPGHPASVRGGASKIGTAYQTKIKSRRLSTGDNTIRPAADGFCGNELILEFPTKSMRSGFRAAAILDHWTAFSVGFSLESDLPKWGLAFVLEWASEKGTA